MPVSITHFKDNEMTADVQTYNPTKRLKALHRRVLRSQPADVTGITLKDFAIDLQTNGTSSEKRIVTDWLDRKAPEVGKAKPAKLTVEPPVKTNGRKR